MRCVCLPCAVYFQSSTHAPAQKGLLALQVDWLVREAQLIPPSGVLHRPGRSDRGAEVLLVMDEVWHAPFPWALLDAAARAAARRAAGRRGIERAGRGLAIAVLHPLHPSPTPSHASMSPPATEEIAVVALAAAGAAFRQRPREQSIADRPRTFSVARGVLVQRPRGVRDERVRLRPLEMRASNCSITKVFCRDLRADTSGTQARDERSGRDAK